MYHLENKQFGRLLVIKKTDIRKTTSNCIFWECKCDCGNTVLVNTGNLVSGSTKSCGCLKLDMIKSNHYSRKEFGESAKNNLYLHYKRGAEKRSIVFDLSKEDFYEVVTKNCLYCGKEASNKFWYKGLYGYYTYTGVDRIDNTIGYTKENSVPCCKRCNQAKNNMTLDEFKSLIVSIYNNYIKE